MCPLMMAAIQMCRFWTLTDSFASSTNKGFWVMSVCSCGYFFPLPSPELLVKDPNPHWNKWKLGNLLHLVQYSKCIGLQTAELCKVSHMLSLSIHHFMSGVVCSLGWCCSLFQLSSHWRWHRDNPVSGLQFCKQPEHKTSAVRKQQQPEVRCSPCLLASLSCSWVSWGEKVLNLAVPKYDISDADDLCMQQTRQLFV